jgi:hypothetical protein
MWWESRSPFVSLGVEGTESPDGFEVRLRASLSEVESNAGILVFSDMLGGTPCNVCLRLARDPGCHFELVTGVNLPMLITALGQPPLHAPGSTGSEVGGRYVPERSTAPSAVAGSSSAGVRPCLSRSHR